MITRMLKLSKAISELEDDSLEAITIKREKQIELDGLKRDIPNKIEESLMEGKIFVGLIINLKIMETLLRMLQKSLS